MKSPRMCPKCWKWMNIDDNGYYCSDDDCGYEIILFNEPIRKED